MGCVREIDNSIRWKILKASSSLKNFFLQLNDSLRDSTSTHGLLSSNKWFPFFFSNFESIYSSPLCFPLLLLLLLESSEMKTESGEATTTFG
jgi:hypothetical protein